MATAQKLDPTHQLAHHPAHRGEGPLWEALAAIPDPEIPVISIVDLGIIREVRESETGIEVTISPTYTGCPAMKMIEDQVKATMSRHTDGEVYVRTELTPPWSTDWISDDARERLRQYGIAPPIGQSSEGACGKTPRPVAHVPCPRCGSDDSELVSRFGSTPCKAHYKCKACLEPFDYFKCI